MYILFSRASSHSAVFPASTGLGQFPCHTLTPFTSRSPHVRVSKIPVELVVQYNLNFSILFVLNTRSVASVVPMKSVRGLVPALPVRAQPAPAHPAGCQVGTPPLMVSTSPLVQRVRPIVFPTLESQLLKISRSENSPVVLL